MRMCVWIIAMIAIAMATTGSSCEKNEPTQPQVVVVQQPAPTPEHSISEETKTEADIARDNVPLPEHIKDGSVAAEKHREKEEFSQDVVEVVPEKKTGLESTYLKVVLKLFDNRDVLEGVRKCIIAASQNNNYKITDEKRISQKSLSMKIWSELGPISVTETLSNALSEYDVTIERKKENLLIVKPR